ncbi:hypothetical protein PORCAN_1312 [Porphyromonas crevioricanis JCM 13913]|nr:hypothetical protein PORCAN_1312 [Porphyromonas crevioricanis JCM 13913]
MTKGTPKAIEQSIKSFIAFVRKLSCFYLKALLLFGESLAAFV